MFIEYNLSMGNIVSNNLNYVGFNMKRIPRNMLGSKGATAVEFALIAPIFFFLVLGTLEFGWYFFVQHTIQSATRDGTRFALVGLQLTGQDNKPMTREASIIKTIQDNAAVAIDPNALQISIYPVTPRFWIYGPSELGYYG